MNLFTRLAGLLAVTASCSAVAAPLLVEGFDDITTLAAKGWRFDNRSSPPGGTSWFQGNPAFFPAAAGPADSYIAANFNNAAFGGAIDNWLYTPALLLVNGETLNFSLRLLGEGALDRVEVYLDSGAGYSLLAGYESATDTGWQDLALQVNGLAAPANGRFAFRYVADDTSLNGNYIGIDTISVSAIPEPATIALMCLGALALGRWPRSRPRARRNWLAALGLSSLAVAAHAGDHGLMQFPHVTVVAQPAASTPVAPGGFMAYKDPLTGQLTRPDPEQAALLRAAARANAPLARQAPPQLARPQHGGVSLMLEERQARYATARKNTDGGIDHRCQPRSGERQ
ncbi:PEP-CTERM sorting domain-containing protein [Duganella sp. FT94W]|uniref:PEP-CTERM sorting domain-containing protein n=1 Tax=Duganella lactea TaxID=2692173 RepID=A0ABW9V6A4_9BURK|nr:choice-of-anchor J domain-containing protein [Duganella lactea]MYM35201.1 PEP-CTERM sorting domain-containing protein [Duganella lactea]